MRSTLALRLAALMFVANVCAISPAVLAQSSRSIRTEISEGIDKIEGLGGHEIAISVRMGDVVLDGYVASEEDRDKVLDLVRNIDGVDELEDKLQIRAVGSGRTSALALAVKDSIASYAKNSSYEIQINVVGTVAMLSGEVFSVKDREDLEQAALRTPGITGVDNKLRVSESDDETLAKVVEIEIMSSPTIKVRELIITSDNGVVTLAGKVGSSKDIGEALAIVLNIPGVRDVKSDLKVGR